MDQPITSSLKKAPTHQAEPLVARLRRLVLMGSWIIGVLILLVLWTWQAQALSVWGLVDGFPVPVAGTITGRVAEIKVAVGDHVEAGMLVAHLHQTDLHDRLKAAEENVALAESLSTAELENLDAALLSDLAEGAIGIRKDIQDQIDSRMRIAVALQETRTSQASLDQELHAARSEAVVINAELTRVVDLTQRGLMAQNDLVSLRQRQSYLSALLEIGPKRADLLAEEGSILDEIALIQKNQPQRLLTDELEQSAERQKNAHAKERAALFLQHAVEIAEKKAEVLALRIELAAQTLVSPVSGIVSAIVAPVGTVVVAASPVMQIIPTPAHRVVAWIGERQAHIVKVGDSVRVHPTGIGSASLLGRVVATGGAVDLVPATVRFNFTSADRGLPVLIEVSGGDVMPGERVEIRFGGAPWWAIVPW